MKCAAVVIFLASACWAQFDDITPGNFSVGFARLAADPTVCNPGQVWFNTTTNLFKECQAANTVSVFTTSASSSFPLLATNGSSGAPSYSFSNFTSTGVFVSAGPTLNLSVGGTAQITATGSAVTIPTDNLTVTAGTITGASVLATAPQITAGADATVNNAGEIRRVVYKATVTASTCSGAAGFIVAGLNADCVIATLPAKAEVTRIIVDNTAGWTCSATCTGTKTVQFGKTTGGNEYLVAKDVTVIATYGLANGDLGAALTTSATTPVGGGDLPSFSATTTLKARWVSGTGNWGNGSVTNVNAGSTTFYIETLIFP